MHQPEASQSARDLNQHGDPRLQAHYMVPYTPYQGQIPMSMTVHPHYVPGTQTADVAPYCF